MTNSTSSAPQLESWIARAGIIGVAGLSAYVGWSFWEARGDRVLACLTLACEAVALGGMCMVLYHGRRSWGRAVGGLLVTALAAGWAGLTMFEKLNGEAQARSAAIVEASPAYKQAQGDLNFATDAYRTALVAQVPEGLGPLITQARTAENAQRRAASKAERDQAQARLDKLTPSPGLDMLAVVRGAGIEIAKLIGLVVFGFGFQPSQPAAVAPSNPAAELARKRWKMKSAA